LVKKNLATLTPRYLDMVKRKQDEDEDGSFKNETVSQWFFDKNEPTRDRFDET
jgi:hypothetical protein